MAIEQRGHARREEELASKENYEPALETLRRFAEMVGGKLVQPSGIIRRSGRRQWQSHSELRLPECSYSSRGRARAK